MFLSSHEITQSREHTLSHFHALSADLLDAGQKLSDVLSTAGRDCLLAGSKHLACCNEGELDQLVQFPAAFWLDSSALATRLLDSTYEIAAETHKRLIASVEAQVRVFDHLLVASIDRASKRSPWEAEIALSSMRSSLAEAEKTMQEMSHAAIEAVDAAEHKVHEIAEQLTEPKPAAKTPRARSKASTNTV